MITRHHQARIGHRAVNHNGTLYVGGHAADDLSLDMKGQTRQTCEKLEKTLNDFGSDKSRILAATIFITDMSKKPEMDSAWLDWIEGRDLPTRATIGVADLGDPSRLIEIVLIAAAD